MVSMIHFNKLFTNYQLDEALNEGLVSAQQHPKYPYTIYNYTPRAQYSNTWNAVTRQSRGLILNAGGDVVARPPQKFFNYGDKFAPSVPLDAKVTVTDKLDGSLVIAYRTPEDTIALATRGRFDSPMAIDATKIFAEKYQQVDLPRTHTFYFEYIAPDNRVILDYGELRDIILLGAIDNKYGTILDSQDARRLAGWTGLAAEQFVFKSFREMLDSKPRPNAEGYVIHYANFLTKFKQQDYLDLHRLRFGMSPLVIWKNLAEGKTGQEIAEPLPDEFQKEITDIADELAHQYAMIKEEVYNEYSKVQNIHDRKEYAQTIQNFNHKFVLFTLRDGGSEDKYIWELVKPTGNVIQ